MPKPDVQIWEADPRAIPVIQAIAQATWGPTYGAILSAEQSDFMLDWMYSTAALTRQMAEGCRFLLLQTEDQPLGFASFQNAGGGVFKLHKLYLQPQTQGKGFGRVLLDAVVQRVRQEGGVCLDLNVNRNNSALAFYQKQGFKLLREETNYIGRGFWMDDFVLRLDVVKSAA